MPKCLTLLLPLLFAIQANGQDIYNKAYGEAGDPAVIFLHGGPGYNSVSFETTAAKKLADRGLYVIVYDRRGEGRSEGAKAEFSFRETFADLDTLYAKYGLTTATLIGHSFGGILATLYAEEQPKSVSTLVLVGAPASLQETFRTIQATVKQRYLARGDSSNLKYISLLETMDSTGLDYASYTFAHAMQNGLYSTSSPTAKAMAIHAAARTDSLMRKYGSYMSYPPPLGFWKNERYTTLDLTDKLRKLSTGGLRIRGIYGKEDGLYSPAQIAKLKRLIGENHVEYWDNCSHTVFMDRQAAFINALVRWAR